MAGGSTSLLKFLRRFGISQAGDATDTDLLGRFAAGRDEAAFGALVQRHGPMVLGLCQRVLGNTHDAEDAFQATFLVLARKVGSAGQPRLLASWLYGVAYRTALKAKAEKAKRRAKERQVEAMPAEDRSPDVVWADLRPVLDEEIDRLPLKYRLPLVLCYLEGKTNEEAALLIGCPKGTVLSRLAWARERLRSRLSGRGVTLSAGLFTTLLVENAASAVPALLVGSTARAGVAFASGKAVGVVSRDLIQLAEGVLKIMLATKLRKATALVLTAALAVPLAGALTRHALADKPEAQPEEPRPAVRPVSFRQTQVSADDIVAVTGLNVYKFQLDIPRGEKFKVMLRELPHKNAEAKVLHHWDFTKAKDGPLTLRVSFLRRDRKLEGVLLSQEKEAEYRVDCEGCSPPGIVTIVRTPLAAVRPTERLLSVMASDKAVDGAKEGPARLLAVFHSKPGVPAKGMDSAYPRAELTVTRLPKKD